MKYTLILTKCHKYYFQELKLAIIHVILSKTYLHPTYPGKYDKANLLNHQPLSVTKPRVNSRSNLAKMMEAST